MSLTLNGSSALQHFECGNMVELHNGILSSGKFSLGANF